MTSQQCVPSIAVSYNTYPCLLKYRWKHGKRSIWEWLRCTKPKCWASSPSSNTFSLGPSFRTKDLHPSLTERMCTMDTYIRGGVIVVGYLFQVRLLLLRTVKQEERLRGLAYVQYPLIESCKGWHYIWGYVYESTIFLGAINLLVDG